MNNGYYENIYWRGTDLWLNFVDKKIFVAGGTGFYGSWFVGFLTYLKEKKGFPLEVQWGSRANGWQINNCNTYTSFQKQADYIINCAGSPSTDRVIDEIIYEHIAGPISLASALKPGAVMLQISSGIVNRDTGDIQNKTRTAYADAKKAAEWYLSDMGANVRIVRPFATVGPGIGLEKHFAVSTFIRLALSGQPLEVSNRPVVRSFVHIVDLIVQMFHVLMSESRNAYDVGSDDPITIREAAELVSNNIKIVEKDFPTNALDSYVANIDPIRKEFNLGLDFSSKSAILDTYHYYAARPATLPHT